VLAERVSEYVDLDLTSLYMLLVANVNGDIRISMTEQQEKLELD
jgi:hypothetical protein